MSAVKTNDKSPMVHVSNWHTYDFGLKVGRRPAHSNLFFAPDDETALKVLKNYCEESSRLYGGKPRRVTGVWIERRAG